MDRKIAVRRIFRLGTSRVVVLPKGWAEELPDFVWLEKKNGEIVIRPAEVT
jgi:antitoxin component of MazEF toxin-antitoxin module